MANQNDHGAGSDPQQGPNVTVKVDNIDKVVHRGSYIVANFKSAVGVDEVKVLDQIVDGSFTELKDDGRIVIKGGEVFISHARDGGSS